MFAPSYLIFLLIKNKATPQSKQAMCDLKEKTQAIILSACHASVITRRVHHHTAMYHLKKSLIKFYGTILVLHERRF